jgi:predicted CoA-binding protein
VGEVNEIHEVLRKYHFVAVVGLSRDPSKDSHIVAKYLLKHGFEIVCINPFADEIFGQKCYPILTDIPEELQSKVEIVDIFRPSQDVPQIVEKAIELRRKWGSPHVIWMQQGIVNEDAAEVARKVGFKVFMDLCIMNEHILLPPSNG